MTFMPTGLGFYPYYLLSVLGVFQQFHFLFKFFVILRKIFDPMPFLEMKGGNGKFPPIITSVDPV